MFIAADTSAVVRAIGVSLLGFGDALPQQGCDRRQPARHQRRLLPLARLDLSDQGVRTG
jgi:hypothetical protein